MRIGVPKEIKTCEYRDGLTPESVRVPAGDGYRVVVESATGAGIGAFDGGLSRRGGPAWLRLQRKPFSLLNWWCT